MKWTEGGQFAYDGDYCLEVLPGHHTVKCGFFQIERWSSQEDATVEFDAEPGQVYVLDREVDYSKMWYRPFVREATEEEKRRR